MSCRTGPLLVGRSLRDLCTLSWQVHTFGPPVGRNTLGWLLEELFDVGDVVGEAVGWEGVEEDAAVALALDAGVEEHEDAAVVEAADEAAEALLEGDDGVGDLVVEERLAAERFRWPPCGLRRRGRRGRRRGGGR